MTVDTSAGWRVRVQRWFPSLVLWCGLTICVAAIARGQSGTAAVAGLLDWPTVAGIAGALIGVFGTAAAAWRLLMSERNAQPLPLRIAIEHVGMLQIGKYIPGKIFGIVARASEPVPGFPAQAMISATLHEQVLSFGCALMIGTSLLMANAVPPWVAATLLLIVVPVLAATVYPSISRVTTGLIMRMPLKVVGDIGGLTSPSRGTTAAVAASFTLQWLAVGGLIALMLESQRIDVSSWMALTCAYALATVGGMLTLVVPSGIGVREGLFVGLAVPVIGEPAAITLAAMLRLVLSSMDLAGGALAIGVRRVRGR